MKHQSLAPAPRGAPCQGNDVIFGNDAIFNAAEGPTATQASTMTTGLTVAETSTSN